jgi:signal peptidase II
MSRPFLLRSLVIFITVTVLDQISKYLADTHINPFEPVGLLPVLQLVNVKNRGAAFGMFAGLGNVFFISVSLAAIMFIIYLIIRGRDGCFSLSLILSGAVGNLLDRLVYGHVRDFIDVFVYSHHWPAFNVADSALTVGLLLYIICSLRVRKPNVESEA